MVTQAWRQNIGTGAEARGHPNCWGIATATSVREKTHEVQGRERERCTILPPYPL